MPGARIPDERVLDAAERVLETGSWGTVTAEKVAAEAGISRVTLHRRGWTKGVILAALATRAEARYRERMWPVLTGPGTARERLALALKAICELAEESLNLLIALDAQANAGVFHEVGDEEALTRSVFTEPLERLLTDGVEDGTLRSVEPLETATVLFNMVGWTYIHLRSGHNWSPRRAGAKTVEIVLTGVSP